MSEAEGYAGGPLVLGATVFIEREAFASAVDAFLEAVSKGRDAPEGGATVRLHPSKFRAMLELRGAMSRACGVTMSAQGWDDLLRVAKPSFPAEEDGA